MAHQALGRRRPRRLAAGGLAGALLALLVAMPAPASSPSVGVIVQGTTAIAAAAALEAAGGTVERSLPIIDGAAGDVTEASLPALRQADGVLAVTMDAPVHVQTDVSPVHKASAVYRKVMRAAKLNAKGVTGEGVTVAVIDTGIKKVKDLAGRVIAGIDLTEENDPFKDSFGHATFIAGLIAGNGKSSFGKFTGVAPRADLVSVKIAGRNGASDVSHVLAALQWVVSFRETYDIQVVNVSLGTDSTQSYEMSPLNFAVERAWDSGIVVVVSASNRGLEGDETVTKPGDDPLVITVGAIDDLATVDRTDDVMAGFSGRGPTAADGLDKPDIVASGRSVIGLRAPGSTIDTEHPEARVQRSYFKGSGTSFSTGIVSGAVALLLDDEPGLTPDQVKHRLLSTARPGPADDPNVDGHGSLDAWAAAHSTSTESANQNVDRSLGLGLLADDRGTLGIQIDSTTVPKVLTGELTAQDLAFSVAQYTGTEWTGTSWHSSQWTLAGTSWHESEFSGTSWHTTWYGFEWQ